jgi:predicted Fe-Mo cluster-binding NifX family protein
MLAGNMGQGALNVLEAQRIQVVRGCSGDVRELAEAFLKGEVSDNGEACSHHDCH